MRSVNIYMCFMLCTITSFSAISQNRPVVNCKSNNENLKRVIKGFDFFISQRGFKYNSEDSMFYDNDNFLEPTNQVSKACNNETIDTSTCLNTRVYLSTKVGLTLEEKIKIFSMAKNAILTNIPNYIEIRNIHFSPNAYQHFLMFKFKKDSINIFSWDGIYPDFGNNTYVGNHKKLIYKYEAMCDTLYSILKSKSEIKELYSTYKSGKCPIKRDFLKLSKLGIPKSESKNIGKYKWAFVISD